MLKTVQFAGIKSLRGVTLELDPFTVLVGPNGCGKSTLLNQVEFVCDASSPARTFDSHVLGWTGRRLADLGGSGPYGLRTSGVKVDMQWLGTDTANREFSIVVPPQPEATWYQFARAAIQEGATGTQLSGSRVKPDDVTAFDDILRSDFGWRAQRLRLIPDDIAAPSPTSMTELEPSGFGLPTILKDLAGNNTAMFESVQVDLRRVVPHFQRLRFDKATLAKGGDVTTLLLEMQGGGRLPAAQVSDGTLLALAVLTAAHNPDMPSLILIDDLDHGLHLTAQYAMVKAIRTAMESRPALQVLCTTHSPFMFEDIEGASVRVMALDKEGYTRVKCLSEHPDYERWRKVMSTGEVWANLGENWVLDG